MHLGSLTLRLTAGTDGLSHAPRARTLTRPGTLRSTVGSGRQQASAEGWRGPRREGGGAKAWRAEEVLEEGGGPFDR